MTDIIIGLATGYGWRDVEPFVISLRQTGYQGKCVLITDDISDSATLKELSGYNIDLHDIGPLREHCVIARFTSTPAIFSKEKYRYALLVDVKDIIFQSDPIVWLEKNLGDKALALFSSRVSFGNSESSKAHFIRCFGEEEFKKVESVDMRNAGIIAGKASDVDGFLWEIHKQIKKDLRGHLPPPFNGIKSYEETASDQDALNLVLTEEPWNSITKIVDIRDGFIFGCERENWGEKIESQMLRNGVLYPENFNEPFSIVHQYNRFPILVSTFKNRYMR